MNSDVVFVLGHTDATPSLEPSTILSRVLQDANHGLFEYIAQTIPSYGDADLSGAFSEWLVKEQMSDDAGTVDWCLDPQVFKCLVRETGKNSKWI